MKRKMFLVSLLAIVIGYSCQNEFVGIENNSDKVSTRSLVENLSVTSAKQYFEANIHKLEIPGSYVSDVNPDCNSENCKLHNHAPSKALRKVSNNHLPELNASNIVLEWTRSHSWKEGSVSYVEVPMNMGRQMFALKKSKKAGEKLKHERTRIESMLVFRQIEKEANPKCYVVTLIGHKKYLRKNAKKVNNMCHKPTDTDFSGYALYTTVQGKVTHALTYEDGKVISKLTPIDKTASSTPEHYTAISLFDMSSYLTTYNTGWEYEQCDDCGCWHYLYEGCKDSICLECHYNLDDCICCFSCSKVDCICCPYCYAITKDSCSCCSKCKHSPCICCSRCGEIGNACYCCPKCDSPYHCLNCEKCPCACCQTCGSYPCECYICKKCYREPCACPKNIY